MARIPLKRVQLLDTHTAAVYGGELIKVMIRAGGAQHDCSTSSFVCLWTLSVL